MAGRRRLDMPVTPLLPRGDRKDLQDLTDLPRSPVLSFLQKQTQPKNPRPRTVAAKPSSYPKLMAFMPQRLWTWFREYLRFRIGKKHPFKQYADNGADNGVYQLNGTDNEIRVALAGDWGTGTDEAAIVADLINA